nr:hypothetical protein [Tanacetum cinerariifolium]
MLAVRDIAEEAEAHVPAQGDDVHEHVVEEVATDVVPPTPTSSSPSSPVIPSSSPHQSPYPPQPQDAVGSSHLFQQVVAASTPIPAAKPKILKIAAAPASSIKRRKGVVIRDPEEELHTDTLAETPTVKEEFFR